MIFGVVLRPKVLIRTPAHSTGLNHATLLITQRRVFVGILDSLDDLCPIG